MRTVPQYRYATKVIPFRSTKAPAYPNAAQRRDQVNKLLDYILTAAASTGIVAALLFLITFL